LKANGIIIVRRGGIPPSFRTSKLLLMIRGALDFMKANSRRVGLRDNKREFHRYTFAVPAIIEILSAKGRKKKLNLRTANISAAGAFFLTENPLPEGTQVKINIFLQFKEVRGSSDTDGHIVMKVTGRILRAEPTGMAIGFNRDYDVGYISKFIGPGHC
jgi:hypothetical protein